jgi:Glycosyltransferase family 87
MAVLVWLYRALHFAHQLGGDFAAVYRGPYDLWKGESPYPTTSSWSSWTVATHQPFYVHTPSAPIVLAPLGLASERTAGAIFIVLSVAVFTRGLWELARPTGFPALILLGAGLSLPVAAQLGLGQADLLPAGLLALAVSRYRYQRATLVCLALAVKPTLWPIVIVLGVWALAGLAGAVLVNVAGIFLVRDSDRFFRYVVPYLSKGQKGVPDVRTSLPDAAASAGIAHPAASIICTVLLLSALCWIAVYGRSIWAAPLIAILVIVLSPYSYVYYCVYLIAFLPLLRPRDSQLVLLGVSLYLICVPDVWSSNGLPSVLNTMLDYKVLLGLILLTPIAALPLVEQRRRPTPVPRPAEARGSG